MRYQPNLVLGGIGDGWIILFSIDRYYDRFAGFGAITMPLLNLLNFCHQILQGSSGCTKKYL